MFRTARRLRLEPFEDRFLPSAPVPIAHSPADTAAHASSPAREADSDDAEYANKSKSDTASPPTARVQVPDYVIAAYPAAPPMPAGLTTSKVPAAAPAPPGAAPAVPAMTPAPAPIVQIPSPPPPAPEQATPPPSDDRPDDGPIDAVPVPPVGTGEQPAGSDIEFPPVGGVSSALPFLDNLDLRLNVSDWAEAATRLLDGLDTLVGLPDAESPWARLGYWALVIGTVGVTVELTRQGLRAKEPEPAGGPQFPVTR